MAHAHAPAPTPPAHLVVAMVKGARHLEPNSCTVAPESEQAMGGSSAAARSEG